MNAVAQIGAVLVAWSMINGCAAPDELTGPCTPVESREFTEPWNQLSDAELYSEIVRACGHVFVGFKEASAPRGVDSFGVNLTSPATVASMKQYLLDRGFTFEWVSSDLPHGSGRIPLSQRLVSEVRRHSNIDYLEPIFPGVFLGRD